MGWRLYKLKWILVLLICMICFTSRNVWGRQVIHIQMLKHAKINSVFHVYKKLQICGMNYFIFWLKRNNMWAETIFRREEFVFCKVSCESNLKNRIGCCKPSVQRHKTTKQRKQRQVQNFPVQQEKDSIKMKAFTSEKYFRKSAQEGAALGLLSVG